MLQQLVVRTRNTYTNAVERTMTFAMGDSEYIIANIDGLGPVKSEVSTIAVPGDAGAAFLNSRDVTRNIVITFGFEPNYTTGSSIETLRRALYSVLVPSTQVELVFTDSILGDMTIVGRVESHEPTIFSAEPQVQVSILCVKPYFKSAAGIQTFSIPNGAGSFTLNYPGDVPIGFVFEGDFQYAKNPLYIANLPASDNGYVNVAFNFLANDHFLISTVPGDRKAQYIRSAATTNILGYASGSLTKLKLRPGANYFDLSSSGAFINNGTIKYERLYGSL